MSDQDDEWDDLFAKAAAPPAAVPMTTLSSHASRSKRKRKSLADRNAPSYLGMLESRCSLQVERKRIDSTPEWHILAYQALVNLRWSALEAVEADKKFVQCVDATRTLAGLTFPSYLGQGEVYLLGNKQQRIQQRYQNADSNRSILRLIMACDDLYFRLYYLQTIGSVSESFLPHPITYFSRQEGGQSPSTDSKLSTFAKLCKDHPEIEALFGLHQTTGHHILSKLHQMRTMETLSLLRASVKETTQALNRPCPSPTTLECHETPADPLLKEWRDSCRDVLCHLYCYATIAPCALSSFVAKLKEVGVSSIVELGAGTGYFAKLLQDAGLKMQAYDMHPPLDELNEYHGRTAPFCKVQKGTHKTVSFTPRQALLLCYPPPQSSMAYDALLAFCKAGGQHFIHVGEWKGLTGSAEFEELLLQECYCIHRSFCLTWGTDASHLSIWKRGSKESKSLLLPCIACGEKEAVRRCRLIRHAVYCSKECFLSHEEKFQALCDLYVVPKVVLEFSNNLHFQPLSPRMKDVRLAVWATEGKSEAMP